MKVTRFVLSVLLASTPVYAITINVPADQPTIQAGIDAAVNGDTVTVAPGEYDERFTFNGKSIVVQSLEGPLTTTVIGSTVYSPNYSTVTFDHAESRLAVLRGFTFRGGPIAILCLDPAGPVIERNIFIDQTYNSWAALVIYGPALILNNTICYGANGGIACYTSAANIKNNIIAFNRQYGIAGSGVQILQSYNDVYGSHTNFGSGVTIGPTSISLDPAFVSGTSRDFHLLPVSPCVDAGDPDAALNDMDGTRSDIGALYVAQTFPLPSGMRIIPEHSHGIISSRKPQFEWTYVDTASSVQSSYQIEVGLDDDWSTAEMWNSGTIASSANLVDYAGSDLEVLRLYFARVRVYNGVVWGSWKETAFTIDVPVVIHVPADQQTIQAAVDAARPGDTILVAPGEYSGNIDYRGKTLKILGSGAEFSTLLNCSIYIGEGCGAGTELANFEVIAGNVGVVYGAVDIHNCVFHDCPLSDPFVINLGSPGSTVTHNLFYNNGGSACIVAGNGARIDNNTFDGNQAGFGGPVVARNNIITNSSGVGIGGWVVGVIEYNNVWNNHPNYADLAAPGTGCLTVDPKYMNPGTRDYFLPLNSPCVNAGSPDTIYNDADGSRNDIGAYSATYLLPLAAGLNFGGDSAHHLVSHAPTLFWHFYDAAGSPNGVEAEVGTDSDWSVAEKWSSGQMFVPDTFLTYAGATLVDGEIYRMRIRLFDGSHWGSWRYISMKMNGKPTVPSPIFPSQETTVSAVRLRLATANSADPQSDSLFYDFEVYSDESMTQLADSNYNVPSGIATTKSKHLESLLAGQTYWWRCRSFDGYEHSPWSGSISFQTRQGAVIHVPTDYTTVQTACDAASNGDTILVASGVYNEPLSLTDKYLVIKSSSGPLNTIITASANQDLITFTQCRDTLAVLEGFSLVGGAVGIRCVNSGPLIRNNILIGQRAYGWAALALAGVGTSTGSSPAVVLNNTIMDCVNGGIVVYSTAAPIIKNNIIAQNVGYGIALKDTYIPHPIMSYNDIYGNGRPYYYLSDLGPGALAVEPLLTQNGALTQCSPCIDAGDPASLFNDSNGTRNDLGAIPFIMGEPHSLRDTVRVPSDVPNVQAALSEVNPDGVILVGPGIYEGTILVTCNPVTIKSTGGPLVTTLTAPDSADIVVFKGFQTTGSVLDGFTILGGQIGVRCINSAPMVKHNLLIGQKTRDRGAIVMAGAAQLNGVAPAKIVNNTIVSSLNNGISSQSDVAPIVKNNIIASNSNYGVSSISPQPTMSYNDVFGNRIPYYNVSDPGAGALAVDPQFATDHSLLPISPCIDAGDPQASYKDPDGTRNDMGALYYTCCVDPERGNVNMSGIVDLADLSALVSYLTGGGYSLPCSNEANVNASGIVDLSDLSSLVSYLTGGGFQLQPCR